MPIKDYPGTQTDAVGRHHMEVSQLPILRGQLLTINFLSSSTAQAPHSLGRPYVGAMPVASTQPNVQVVALAPVTASAMGIQIKTTISLTASTSWTGSVTLWVF